MATTPMPQGAQKRRHARIKKADIAALESIREPS
jgi:hypothetical protein